MPIAQHLHSKAMSRVHDEGVATNKDIKNFIRGNKLNVTFSPHKYGKEHPSNKAHVAHAQAAGPSYVPNFGRKYKPDFVNGRASKSGFGFTPGKGFVRDTIKGQKYNNDFTMHELGHAKNYQALGKYKTHAAIARGVSNRLSGAAGLLATHEKTRDYALPAYAAMAAPTLIDETLAHGHAHKFLRKAHGAAAGNKFLRTIAPALGTYYANAGMGAVAVAGLSWAPRCRVIVLTKHIKQRNYMVKMISPDRQTVSIPQSLIETYKYVRYVVIPYVLCKSPK